MRYQDQVVRATQKALDDIVRAAQAVPADKLDWSAGGAARSVLNQMQEIAISGDWFVPILRDRQVPAFDEHARKESGRLMKENDTLEKCVAAAQAGTSALCRAIAAFPSDALEDELVMPFGGGMRLSMADIMTLHRDNMVYHTGQINFVQLLLGDREMH